MSGTRRLDEFIRDSLDDIRTGFVLTWICACGRVNPAISEVCHGCGTEPVPPPEEVTLFYQFSSGKSVDAATRIADLLRERMNRERS